METLPTGHKYAPAPPPLPAPLPAPVARTRELPATHFWPTGLLTHEQTTSVFHRMQPIGLDGHDLGRMIPHFQITPAPNNALLPMIYFQSSRTNNFKAPTVKMNEKPVGTFVLANVVPMPMTSCSEPVALPTTDTPTSCFNGVRVGMSWAAYVISSLALLANALVAVVLHRRDRALADQGLLEEVKKMRKLEFLGGLMSIDDLLAFGLKSAVAAAASVARLAFTHADGKFPLLAGAPFGLEITRTADGHYGLQGSATLTKGKNSIKVSGGGAEDGSMQGGVEYARETKKRGQADRYGQEASSKTKAALSGKRSADGEVEVTGKVARETSEGNADKAQVTYADDGEGKSSATVEVSRKDAYGTENRVVEKSSRDASAGTTKRETRLEHRSAAGEAKASNESVYPNSPRAPEPPTFGLVGGPVL